MSNKKKRTVHTAEFKTEALKLAERVGVSTAAKQLNLSPSQIYTWRRKVNKTSDNSEREAEMAAEIAKLKRQLAEQAEELDIVKKAATYFAKNQK